MANNARKSTVEHGKLSSSANPEANQEAAGNRARGELLERDDGYTGQDCLPLPTRSPEEAYTDEDADAQAWAHWMAEDEGAWRRRVCMTARTQDGEPDPQNAQLGGRHGDITLSGYHPVLHRNLLVRVDSIVVWHGIVEDIIKLYASFRRVARMGDKVVGVLDEPGGVPVRPETLARMVFLQQAYQLSDEGMEWLCNERLSFRMFVQFAPGESALRASTWRRFRSQLASSGLETRCMTESLRQLDNVGLELVPRKLAWDEPVLDTMEATGLGPPC